MVARPIPVGEPDDEAMPAGLRALFSLLVVPAKASIPVMNPIVTATAEVLYFFIVLFLECTFCIQFLYKMRRRRSIYQSTI